jgi:hypothetical protein
VATLAGAAMVSSLPIARAQRKRPDEDRSDWLWGRARGGGQRAGVNPRAK